VTDPMELHRRAMECADGAWSLRRTDGPQAGHDLLVEAFEAEAKAAWLVAAKHEYEPTRSILLRSAATLGIDCGRLGEAERLAAAGLAGTPPEPIATELREVLADVSFRRHLASMGVTLEPGEVEMRLGGRGLGSGQAWAETLFSKIHWLQTMVYRFADRLARRPYREGGGVSYDVRSRYGLIVSGTSAGSFVVSMRIGTTGQLDLFQSPVRVVSEVIGCLDLVNAGKAEEIRAAIPEEAYWRNFIGLARKLAPDGSEIDCVGLALRSPEDTRKVELRRPASQIRAARQDAARDPVTVVAEGRLSFAEGVANRNLIKLEPEIGDLQTVHVPEGMLADIVRPLWGEVVRVRGRRRGQVIDMDDIEPVE